MFKKKIGEITEILYNLIKKHWIIYSITIFLPTIWFSFIINYYGVSLKLLTVDTAGNKRFTGTGSVVTYIIVFGVFLITLFNNYYSSRSRIEKLKILEGENIFLKEICDSTDIICNEKLEQLKTVLHNVVNKKMDSPVIISNPSNQLKRILEQINNCLANLMTQAVEKYSYNDFNLSLAYNFPFENSEWYCVEGICDNEFSVDYLLNSKSTINYLLQSTKPYYFNNKKEDAKKCDQYLYNSTDEINAENEEILGSVFCYKIHIKKNSTIYINAVLTITTKQKRFVQDDDKIKVNNARENILKLVRDHFVKRISVELILLYLERYDIQNKMSKETAYTAE